MNYIKQLNAFSKLRMEYLLSPAAMCLYYVLMEYSNSLGFPDKIKVPNERLAFLSALSLSTMRRAREELCSRKFIKYKKGESKREAGEYEIIILYEDKFDTRYGRNVTPNVTSNVTPNVTPNPDTYNKINKNKINKSDYNAHARRKKYDEGWHNYDFEAIEQRALKKAYGKCLE